MGEYKGGIGRSDVEEHLRMPALSRVFWNTNV